MKDLIERHFHSVCSIDHPTARQNVQNYKILGTNSRSSVRNRAGKPSNISCKLGGRRLIFVWGTLMILQHYSLQSS